MKKLILFLISILILIILPIGQVGCGRDNGTFSLYCPDGAPALSVSKIIADSDNLGTDGLDVNVVSATVINSAITQKKADFVIVPVLSATKLYNADKNNPYVLVSVITHGNFFLLTSFNLSDVSDLTGKVVLIPQNRNTVPDLTLKAVLKAENLEYVESDSVVSGKVALSYKGSGSAVIASLPVGGSSSFVAYLPEPAVTNASAKKNAYSYRTDVQELFDQTNKSYPQAVLMAKVSTVKSHPELISKLKSAIDSSVLWAEGNPFLAVSAVKKNFSASELPDNLSVSSVKGCNVFWDDAENEKQNVINYIKRIKEISSASAETVEDAFFYE